jgi:hypothetical protein
MKDERAVGILVLGGLAIWALTRKPKAAPPPKPEAAPPEWVYTPPPKPKEVTTMSAENAKQPATDGVAIPLEAWQQATSEEISHIPVLATEKGTVGYEEYHKTSEPIEIGDTGFKIWGVTESGTAVISKRDPSTYEPWEWLI